MHISNNKIISFTCCHVDEDNGFFSENFPYIEKETSQRSG